MDMIPALLVLAFSAALFLGALFALTGGRRPSTLSQDEDLALGDQPKGEPAPPKTLKEWLTEAFWVALGVAVLVGLRFVPVQTAWTVEVLGRPYALTIPQVAILILLPVALIQVVLTGLRQRMSLWKWLGMLAPIAAFAILLLRR